MKYYISQRVCNLAANLLTEGYKGTIEFASSYPSGIADELSGSLSLKLSGFCKESLYLTEETETENIHAFGRYSLDREECDDTEFEVKDIVEMAWSFYQCYKAKGYSMPEEFVGLFEKYEFIKKKVVTKTIWEEVQ